MTSWSTSKKFVLVLVDKVSNNIAILCKRFCVEDILNEIGVTGDGSKTYCKANKSCDGIIDKNTEYTKYRTFRL